MSDERDDDDDTPDSKSSKGPKKRFQEREDDEEDDDRPKKKRRRDEDADDDNRPRSKRNADDADDADDGDDDRPKKKRVDDEEDRPKKRRRSADDGPRVKSNDGIPVLMLLAFIGSAVALFASCVGCGWWSFGLMFGGGDGGGGGSWSGNEMEVTSASRTPGLGAFGAPNVSWSVKALQNPSSGSGQYYVVIKCGNSVVTKQIFPGDKGWTQSSGGPELALKGANGPLEVWVEKRPNPVATGKVVSNVYKVP